MRRIAVKTIASRYTFQGRAVLISVFILIITGISLSFSPASAADRGTPAIPEQPPKAAAETGHQDSEVSSLKQRFKKILDIRGAFLQKSYIKDIDDTQEYSGKFFIKKPDLMMWKYSAPRDERVLIRGMDTLIYKKSQKQAIKTRFDKESYSQVPVALLAGLDNIDNDFDISRTGKDSLQLTPKHRLGYIKSVVIETQSGDMPFRMFTIFDTYGNIMMIELRDVEVNPGLDSSIFKIDLPEDTEVYDMRQ